MLKLVAISFISISFAVAGCNGTAPSSIDNKSGSASDAGESPTRKNEPPEIRGAPRSGEQLSPFVRRVFQDRTGNLWFGTNGDGVIRYDGNSLEYFSTDDGFGGITVRGMVQDLSLIDI